MMAKDITAETEHRSIYLVVFRGSLGVEDCCRYFAINVPIDVKLKQKSQLHRCFRPLQLPFGGQMTASLRLVGRWTLASIEVLNKKYIESVEYNRMDVNNYVGARFPRHLLNDAYATRWEFEGFADNFAIFKGRHMTA